jgi:enterochelin esterase-like enzyme
MFSKTILFVLSLVLFFSCKEDHKTNSSDQKIIVHDLKKINLSNGKIQRIDSFPSDFIRPRTIDVWLPDDYSNDKRYSVLYMHDGQMLFDASKTQNKQEWEVDEIASELMKTNKITNVIVVAIWNIPEYRFSNYFPQKAFELLSNEKQDSLKLSSDYNTNLFKSPLNADNYLKFIVEELKPFIEGNYFTYKDQEHNFIAGSSMGGLISMYAVCEYPDIFEGAACISTHWIGTFTDKNNPIPEAIFKYMTLHLPNSKNHKFYFDYGTESLDQYYPQYLDDIDKIFYTRGYNEENYMNLEFEGADHSVSSWNRRLDIPLVFLLKK